MKKADVKLITNGALAWAFVLLFVMFNAWGYAFAYTNSWETAQTVLNIAIAAYFLATAAIVLGFCGLALILYGVFVALDRKIP